MKLIEIQQITHLPEEVLILEKEAVAEGFRFLTRLISEWHSGKNRFNAPGECLMAAYSNQQLAGIGGLSIDPYNQPDTARLRRLYVAPAARNQHVGQALVKALVAQAALHFQKVRLCTDTSRGDAFYLRCGFMRIEDVHATHIIELGNA
ncbi:GNAT family N-acetyltransferase [Pseudomonas caspiana]